MSYWIQTSQTEDQTSAGTIPYICTLTFLRSYVLFLLLLYLYNKTSLYLFLAYESVMALNEILYTSLDIKLTYTDSTHHLLQSYSLSLSLSLSHTRECCDSKKNIFYLFHAPILTQQLQYISLFLIHFSPSNMHTHSLPLTPASPLSSNKRSHTFSLVIPHTRICKLNLIRYAWIEDSILPDFWYRFIV